MKTPNAADQGPGKVKTPPALTDKYQPPKAETTTDAAIEGNTKRTTGDWPYKKGD